MSETRYEPTGEVRPPLPGSSVESWRQRYEDDVRIARDGWTRALGERDTALTERNNARTECDRLRTERDRADAVINTALELRAEAQAECAHAQAECARLRERLNIERETLGETAKAKYHLGRECDLMRAEIENANAAYRKVRDELAAAKPETAELLASIRMLNTLNMELRTRLTVAERELEEARAAKCSHVVLPPSDADVERLAELFHVVSNPDVPWQRIEQRYRLGYGKGVRAVAALIAGAKPEEATP